MLLAQNFQRRQQPQFTLQPSIFQQYSNDSSRQQPQPQPQPQYRQQQKQSQEHWELEYSTPAIPAQVSCHLNESSDRSYTVPSSAEQNDPVDYSTPNNFNNLQIEVPTPFGSRHTPELMQSGQAVAPSSWAFSNPNGQLTPRSGRGQRYRESSFSSLGSASPASPYNHSTSHPQIILPPDSIGSDTYYDGLPTAEQASYHIFPKPLTPSHESFLNSASYGYSQYNPAAANIAAYVAMQKQNSTNDETMPAPEYSHSGRPSVASTHESPATPSTSEEFDDHRKNGEIHGLDERWWSDYSHLTDYRISSSIPKLDRTMSDVYNDELYSPSFAFTSAPTPRPMESTTILSPSHSDVFSQRLQAANSQHLSASTQSPLMTNSRGRSPFRQGSPLAPTSDGFGSQSSQIRLGTAAQMREQQKAMHDAHALQRQIERSSPGQNTPKTISPKDALLDYHESAEDSTMPLFPQLRSPQYRVSSQLPQEASQSDVDDSTSQQSFGSMATSRRESSSAYSNSSQATRQGSGFTFAPPSVPGGVQIPQQYPFASQQRRQTNNISEATDRTRDLTSALTSMGSTITEYPPDAPGVRKPSGTTADGGTYTCTYHGCTLRFETPSKLQRHKREGHRQSMGAPQASGNGSPDIASGMTSAALLRNSQAGPHKCERINPSTGKPCNTIFSRPYDLTRHEDTIHNARKQKVRCQLCTEEKTFSRNDALTRHMRVVHPEVDFPGKSRRRGHD